MKAVFNFCWYVCRWALRSFKVVMSNTCWTLVKSTRKRSVSDCKICTFLPLVKMGHFSTKRTLAQKTAPNIGNPSADDQATRPREGTFRRSPLAELDGGASSFDGHTKGCRVEESWNRRAAARGRVALGRAVASRRIYILYVEEHK